MREQGIGAEKRREEHCCWRTKTSKGTTTSDLLAGELLEPASIGL